MINLKQIVNEKSLKEDGMLTGAEFRDKRTHRLLLWRIWNENKDWVNFIMLNPSTADEKKPDPTLNKCISFAKQNDYGGVIITNLFSYGTPDPRKLYDEQNKRNLNLAESDAWIESAAKFCKCVIVGWGNHGKNYLKFGHRDQEVIEILKKSSKQIFCLNENKDGSPTHPKAALPYIEKNSDIQTILVFFWG